MSFLSRIFGGRSQADEPVRWSWPRIGILSLSVGTGEFSLKLVSASPFEKDVKAARKLHQSNTVPVYLNREARNPGDPEAVSVMSALQERIGYLEQEDAAIYASTLDKVAAAGLRATCTAKIVDRARGESSEISIDLPGVSEIEEKLKSTVRL